MSAARLDYSKLCQLSSLDLAPIVDSEARTRAETMVREFTADVAFAATGLHAEIVKNAGHLVPEAQQEVLPGRAQAVFGRYAVADTLAIYYRDHTKRTFKGLLGLAVAALVIFEIFAHLLMEFSTPRSGARLAIWLFPLLWYLAFKLWAFAHRHRYQEKYNTYRAIAESLRVQFFWTLLEVPDRVDKHFLRKHEGALEWIPLAIARWHDDDNHSFPPETLSPEKQQAHKDLVLKQWVDDQMRFLERAGGRERASGDRCKWWGTFLLKATIGVSLIVGVCEIVQSICHYFEWHGPSDGFNFLRGVEHVEHVLITAIGVGVAAAATAVAFGEKLAFAEHSRQYKATHERYVHLAKGLAPGPLTDAERSTFRDFGIEALEENGEWLLLHRDRPLEIIVP